MGLVIFGAIGIYVLISIGVVMWAIRYARKKGKRVKRWGWGAALAMYLLVFWDWIPTVVTQQYYCATEAGFRVYKTVDQWKRENPGVAETLLENRGAPSTRYGDDTNFTDNYFLNQRINKVVQERRISSVLHIFRHEQALIDRKNDEVLARYVTYRAGYPNGIAGIAPRSAGFAAEKFWLVNPHCNDSGAHPQHQFLEFEKQLTGRQQ